MAIETLTTSDKRLLKLLAEQESIIDAQKCTFTDVIGVLQGKEYCIDLNKILVAEKKFPNIEKDLTAIRSLNNSTEYEKFYENVLKVIGLFDFDSRALSKISVDILLENGESKTVVEGGWLARTRQALVRAWGDLSKIDTELVRKLDPNNLDNIVFPASGIKMSLIDIVGMSKKTGLIGDLAINQLIKYLNEKLDEILIKYPNYQAFVHRQGGDEFILYLEANDPENINQQELEQIFEELKIKVLNTVLIDENPEAEYDLPVTTYHFTKPREDVNTAVPLSIRCEDVYEPAQNDTLGRLIWHRYVQQGLFLSEKELEKRKTEILEDPYSPKLYNQLLDKIESYQANLKLFKDKSKEETAQIIKTKTAEILSRYPFLQTLLDECYEMDKETFGTTDDGLLLDSIASKRLISGIVRTSQDTLLGTLSFPPAFLDWLRKQGYFYKSVWAETKFKAINDQDHTVGDEIISTTAKNMLHAMFEDYYIQDEVKKARLIDLLNTPDSTAMDFIPEELRPYLLLYRDGINVRLELTNYNIKNQEGRDIRRKLNNWIYKFLNRDEAIRTPIMYNGQDTFIFSSFVGGNLPTAFGMLQNYGFVRKEDQIENFERNDLINRYADLNYYLKSIKEFVKLETEDLEKVCNNILKGDFKSSAGHVLNPATQEFLNKSWSDKKRGIGYCEKYLKILSVEIAKANNPQLINKYRQLKIFFIAYKSTVLEEQLISRNQLNQDNIDQQQAEIKHEILDTYKP